jgi:8-oxo-dGTP pyrophosphatase MutT (NUDIX family)
MQTKKHICAGCFLTHKQSNKRQILLIYRSWPGKYEGWIAPKGHTESGETLEETAIRETREETGYKNIVIKDFLQLSSYEFPADDGYRHFKEVHWYHAELVDEEQVEKVLSANEKGTMIKQQWFDLDKARDMFEFEDEKLILDKLLAQV